MSCGDAGDTRPRNWPWEIHMGLVMKIVYPKKPNGFADHYPVFKWLFHWGYTPFSDIPIYFIAIVFFNYNWVISYIPDFPYIFAAFPWEDLRDSSEM